MREIPVLLVLLGPARAEELAAVHAAARERSCVAVCFLQRGEPSFVAELTRLAVDEPPAIRVVAVHTGRASTGRSWVLRVAGHWMRATGFEPRILVAREELSAPYDALDEILAGDRWRPITGRESRLTSPPWEDVPRYRHQALICQGPRCLARGADRVTDELLHLLSDAGLGDDEVLVTATGCQFPCNQAPLLSVQPDDTWYGNLDSEGVAAVVEEHLSRQSPPVVGRSVGYRLPRVRGDLPRRSMLGGAGSGGDPLSDGEGAACSGDSQGEP